ncbi:lipoprotein [Pedobacter rhizosphaerae]|uniref:Uncharacterized protein n=1 Tax=Pedobacter rhizosphaerae TaxID=390241 RepID=A0A1H9SQ62_9SPHI|nr:lipoprotein [Pedobacter rhizosphaerae]SER86998.1 hypothetical protein SAMN04488023_11912 [Pedobacter rhizosphaerae]
MKKILYLSFFVAVLSACSTMKNNSGTTIRLTGKIEKIGMTTFQYGTHLLKADAKTYALKSASLNLDTYLDKQVTIKGNKVEGYPVEGGPEFIEVTEVKEK